MKSTWQAEVGRDVFLEGGRNELKKTSGEAMCYSSGKRAEKKKKTVKSAQNILFLKPSPSGKNQGVVFLPSV